VGGVQREVRGYWVSPRISWIVRDAGGDRWYGPARRDSARTYGSPYLTRADATHRRSAAPRAARGHLAPGHARGAPGARPLHDARRFPVHAPRVQRFGGPEHLAPGRPVPPREAPAAADPRPVDGAGRGRMGT